MSGRAAGEVLLVVRTREVSCGVCMATSPPLGNIQWNLRLVSIAVQQSPPSVPGSADGSAVTRSNRTRYSRDARPLSPREHTLLTIAQDTAVLPFRADR